MSEAEWRVVRREKRTKRTNGEVPKQVDGLDQDDEEYSPEEIAKLRDKLARYKDFLQTTEWWEKLSKRIRDAIDGRLVMAMNCLGIGSFQENRNACYQLACTLLIKESFASEAKYSIADPAMSKVDRKIASDLGFQLIETTMIDRKEPEEEEVNLVAVSRPRHGDCVLWIMPHCAYLLYEAVLAETNEFGHEGMVFFSNVLSNYDEMMESEDRKRCPNLIQLCADKRFIERDISEPEGDEFVSGFNDLSVITIAEAIS